MNPSRSRVLLAIDSSAAGGGQEIVAALAGGFVRSGLDVTLVTRPGGPLVERAAAHGAAILPFPFSSIPGPFALHRLAGLLSGSGADLVHTHGGIAGAWVRTALVLAHRSPPTVHTYHGIHHLHFPAGPRRWIHGAIDRFLAARTSRLVGVGREDLEAGRRHGLVPAGRGRHIANGIDASRFEPREDRAGCRASLGLPADGFWMGSVGRFHPQKDPLTLVEAFRLVHADDPTARLALVGEGPLEGDVRRALREAGLTGRAWILPSDTDRAAFYGALDAFALGSLWEGLPLVVLEAMAARCPVVATEVTGTRELIDPGRTGLLVPPRQPAALATAIRSLRRGHTLDLDGARDRVREDFGHDRMIREHLALYRELGVS